MELDHLRTGCDLMNLFFVIDEYTDVQDESDAAMIASVTMDALRNPCKPRPHGESIVGEIARQYVCMQRATGQTLICYLTDSGHAQSQPLQKNPIGGLSRISTHTCSLS